MASGTRVERTCDEAQLALEVVRPERPDAAHDQLGARFAQATAELGPGCHLKRETVGTGGKERDVELLHRVAFGFEELPPVWRLSGVTSGRLVHGAGEPLEPDAPVGAVAEVGRSQSS